MGSSGQDGAPLTPPRADPREWPGPPPGRTRVQGEKPRKKSGSDHHSCNFTDNFCHFCHNLRDFSQFGCSDQKNTRNEEEKKHVESSIKEKTNQDMMEIS